MITFSMVQMMFLNFFLCACLTFHCIMSHSAHLQPRMTNLQLCASNPGSNSRATEYRDVWQSIIQHSLLLSFFSLSCLPSQNPPDMKIYSCLGAGLNFHVESQISFPPLGYYTSCTFRKGSVLFSQGVNALKEGNSNFFLFRTKTAFLKI